MKKKKFSLKVFLIATAYIIIALGITIYGGWFLKSIIGINLGLIFGLVLFLGPYYYLDKKRKS